METRFHAQNLTPYTSPAPQAARLAWQVGQLLQATVVAMRDNALILELAGMRVLAQSQLQLGPGQRLTVQVLTAGDQPVLRVLPEQPVQDQNAAMQSLLRTALPRQTGMAPLLANLALLSQGVLAPAGAPPRAAASVSPALSLLPKPVVDLAGTLLTGLPELGGLSKPPLLRQAIRDSGLFLEARLAQLAGGRGQENLALDFKASLLRLQAILGSCTPLRIGTTTAVPPGQSVRVSGGEAHAGTGPVVVVPDIRGTPLAPPVRGGALQPQGAVPASLAGATKTEAAIGQLLRDAQGALARLELHQLASLGSGNATALMLELPVRLGEQVQPFHLRIEEEERGGPYSDTGSRAWTATLAFDFEGLGAVMCRVTVRSEVCVSLWAEREATARHFDEHLGALRRGMERAGLTVGRLSAQVGQPPTAPDILPLGGFLDEQA